MTSDDAPDAPDAISGDLLFCSGIVSTLSSSPAGGVWSNTNHSVATINTDGGLFGNSPGTTNISYAVSNACGSTATTVNAVVLAHPVAAITAASDVCAGYSTTIVFNGTSGATITYQVDAGTINSQVLTGGVFTLNSGIFATTRNYYLIDVDNGSCNTTINQSEDINVVPMTWLGGEFGHATDWNRAANWSCGFVPGASDDVTIPSGTTYSPAIAASGSGTTRNLTIASGATVAVGSSGILNVKGDFTNNGAVTGSGSLSMNGSTAQTIYGSGSVNKFDLNNSTGATINAGDKMTVNAVLSVTAGTLATNDSLTLNSTDTTVAARVAQIPPSGSAISGVVEVKQYIPGGYRRYRFWAHPFSTSISLGQMENYIDVTGVGGSVNGFTTTGSNAASAFRYDPMAANSSLSGDPGWKAFTNITPAADDSNLLHTYQGIRVFMRGQKGQGLGYVTETPLPVTISQFGLLNQGDQVVPLSKGSAANQDYNMIGNPYASPVDLGTVAANAMVSGSIAGTAFYVWNSFLGASGLFQAIPINTVTPTPYFLQANECFQIRAAYNGATMTFTESNKGSNRSLNLMRPAPESVSLYIYDANYHPYDMLHIRFNDGATPDEDNSYDARKLLGTDFGFYSLSHDGQKLSIDTRPYETEKVIPLGVTSSYAQEYIIKAESIVVPGGSEIYLHDKLLGQYVTLEQGSEYRFVVTNDEHTQGDNRFEITMKPALAAAVANGLHVSMTPNPATDEVRLNFTSGKKDFVSVRVLDMSGVCVHSENLGEQISGTVNIRLNSFAEGAYMIEVTSGKDKSIQRLVKE